MQYYCVVLLVLHCDPMTMHMYPVMLTAPMMKYSPDCMMLVALVSLSKRAACCSMERDMSTGS